MTGHHLLFNAHHCINQGTKNTIMLHKSAKRRELLTRKKTRIGFVMSYVRLSVESRVCVCVPWNGMELA